MLICKILKLIRYSFRLKGTNIEGNQAKKYKNKSKNPKRKIKNGSNNKIS